MPFDKLLPGQNFGAMTRSLSSGGLVINAADHAPGMRIPRHEHANAYLCIVLAGGFALQRPGGDVDCIAGTLVAHPAGDSHANRFGEQFGRCMNIHVGDAWGADRALREWLADPRHVRLGASSPALRRLAREMQANDSAAPLAAGAAALELLAEAMRADEPAAPAPWLRRVIDCLESDLAQAPTLTELAAEVGVHPAHLSRAFRRHFGMTPAARRRAMQTRF